jgi:hypothetical protein
MKKIIVLTLINLIIIHIQAQNFVEVKTSIFNSREGALAWGDYDNDGDLDLFISGTDSLEKWHSIIYSNNSGVFTDINANILGVTMAMADWGDYDNDGDIDLLISGADSTFTGRTIIYRNDNGIFTDIKADLIGIRTVSTLKWGDYNGDKKLDIIVNGYSDDIGNYITKIYANNNNSFYDTNIELDKGGDNNSIGWIDIDEDGDLDIFLSGNNTIYTSLYINNNGNFTRIYSDITNTHVDGSSDWADFDNDGDMDVVIMGFDDKSSTCITKIFRNDNNKFIDIGANLKGLSEGVVKWIDFDLDGNLDLFLTGKDMKGNFLGLLYKNENGKFTSISTNIPGLQWSSAAIGDFNNDNKPDIIINSLDINFKPVTKLFKNNTNDKFVVTQKSICGTNESVRMFYAGDKSSIISFDWNLDGGNIISGSNSLIDVDWNTIGEKNVKLILKKNTEINDTLSNTITVYPDINLSIGNDTIVNSGSNLFLHSSVTGGVGPYNYYWNNIIGKPD